VSGSHRTKLIFVLSDRCQMIRLDEIVPLGLTMKHLAIYLLCVYISLVA
jgi:hypothetical protein